MSTFSRTDLRILRKSREKPAKTSGSAKISYDVTFFHREMSPSGPALITAQPVTQKEATISSVIETWNFGLKATVQVKGIEQGKVTFKITLPDGTNQEAEMRDGESKEFFANGRASGVRIRVNPMP